MSQKKVKAERRTEKEKVADYVARRDAFRKEITAASEKYKIDLMGGLKYGDTAIVPMLVFVDVKDKYGNVTPEAQAQNEKEQKANGEVKPEVSPAPKLEV